jgi:hypothetical protein
LEVDTKHHDLPDVRQMIYAIVIGVLVVAFSVLCVVTAARRRS